MALRPKACRALLERGSGAETTDPQDEVQLELGRRERQALPAAATIATPRAETELDGPARAFAHQEVEDLPAEGLPAEDRQGADHLEEDHLAAGVPMAAATAETSRETLPSR